MTNKNFDFINEPGMAALRRSTPQMRDWMRGQSVAQTPEDFETELRSEPREYVPGLVLDTRGVKDILNPQTQARLGVLKALLDPAVRVTAVAYAAPAYTPEFRELLMYRFNKVTHPSVTLGNSLDSFNRKAKKLGKSL
jgi:hypothetical protein